MAWACFKNELNVCKWLYNHGAAEDISNTNNGGKIGMTPMRWARQQENMSVCKWLVLNGAMNNESADQTISIRSDVWRYAALEEWARDITDASHAFLHVVLRASVILPSAQAHQQASSADHCHLPRLSRDELERIGSFLGVETGRQLRNVRAFAEALTAPESQRMQEVAAENSDIWD